MLKYAEVMKEIERKIKNGEFIQGSKLPSIRTLSKQRPVILI
ncbi:hypothetical protein MALU111345_16850 [Marinicrinis lubricantis]